MIPLFGVWVSGVSVSQDTLDTLPVSLLESSVEFRKKMGTVGKSSSSTLQEMEAIQDKDAFGEDFTAFLHPGSSISTEENVLPTVQVIMFLQVLEDLEPGVFGVLIETSKGVRVAELGPFPILHLSLMDIDEFGKEASCFFASGYS